MKLMFLLLVTTLVFNLAGEDPFGDPVILLNSMVVFSSITQDGEPASSGDVVAAFVGDELRGKQQVIIHNEQALAPLLINTQTMDELVSFKLWDSSADSVIIAHTDDPLYTEPGGTLGIPPYSDSPYDIYADRVSVPVLSYQTGHYPNPIELQINCDDPEAIIRYTLDNSYPDSTSFVYNEPLLIENTTFFRAVSYRDGWTQSNPVSAFYSFEPFEIGEVEISVTSHNVDVGEIITVSVITQEIEESWEVCSYGFEFYYNSDLLSFISFSTQNTLSEGGYTLVNSNNPGVLIAGFISIYPITGEGTLIEFELETTLGGFSALEIENFIYNNTNINNIVNGEVTIVGLPVEPPEYDPQGGIFTEPVYVEITCPTEDTDIYYTLDESDPDQGSILYESPIFIDFDSGVTIRSRAYRYGWETSEIVSETYLVTGTLNTPEIEPDSGTYLDSVFVEMSTDDPDAVIRFTTDGINPDENSEIYDSGFTLYGSSTVKAIAYRENWEPSLIGRRDYNIIGTVAQPEFDPGPGLYFEPVFVHITTITDDALIYYTLDGSVPDEDSNLYSAPIEVGLQTEVLIRAIAYYDDWLPSTVSSGNYLVTGVVPDPVMVPEGGVYQNPQLVTLTVEDQEAGIRYSINQGDWHIYAEPFFLEQNTFLTVQAFRDSWQSSSLIENDFIFLNPVTDIEYETDYGVVYLSWNMPLGWSLEDDTFLGFTLYRGIEPDELSVINQDYLLTLFFDDYVDEPGLYYYQLRASYEYGDSELSQIVEVNVDNKLELPYFDPEPGKYLDKVFLHILHESEDAVIYYTLDESYPDEGAEVYTGEILLKNDTTVKAIAFREGWIPSGLLEGFFEIKDSSSDHSLISKYPTKLYPAYPNPFNPATNIKFSLSKNSYVEIVFYNIQGRRIYTLIEDFLDKGSYELIWNGRDYNNKPLSSGVYFYKMKTEDFNQVNKVIILK